MTLGEKLSKLRKENHYTQEQLAEILGVSRQAVSKWESDTAYPETEKLCKLGELYGCSMDYLLKGGEAVPGMVPPVFKLPYYERKSKTYIGSLPLWHINIGHGRTAKGVIAIGLTAKGILAIGLASLGLLSFGVCSVGVIGLGTLALGLLSAGAISCGVVAFGAISVGIVSVGALAVGNFSVGAAAIGKYLAMGDDARAAIAVGDTKAIGSVYQKLGALSPKDAENIRELLDMTVPSWLSWAKELIKWFL